MLRRELPIDIRRQADAAFRTFCGNPAHPSLSFERLRCHEKFWAVRITRNYRAVARKHEETMIWFWIGAHDEFDRKFPV
jgi:hypothetical protein